MRTVPVFGVTAFIAAVAATIPVFVEAAAQKVAIFNLPAGPAYARRDNPPCAASIDLVKLMQDPKRVAALTGNNAKATAVIVGTAEIVEQVRKHGGDIAGLITKVPDGDRSACETACILLPRGAQINEVRVSDRKGAEKWSYKRTGANSHDKNAPTVLQHGGVLNAGVAGDFSGWEGVQVHNGGRAVCGTAKNWSHDTGTHQVLRVIYQ